MTFAYDILIIYTEKDNELIKGGEKGWVTNFERFLKTLSTQIGEKPLTIKALNENEITAQSLKEGAVVLVVSTPKVTRNELFIKELRNFIDETIATNELYVDGFSRIFKIIKYPSDIDKLIPELEEVIPYDFFIVDPLTGEPQEFIRFFGTEAERSYWLKMVDLAYDIIRVLESLKGLSRELKKETIERNKTVYLASTGVDMVIQRDIIKRELLRHGYRVLPEQSLPKDLEQLKRMVREDLARCRLSIHLTGEDYGYKPKGSEFSVVDIQNKIASEHTREVVSQNKGGGTDHPFSRLIWLSPDLKNISERQKIFIEDLKSDAASLNEAEVLQISLQEFKSIIREELVTGGRFKKHEIRSDHNPKDDENLIYLICDKLDVEESKPLEEYLTKEGFGVVSPIFEGDLVDIRYVHQENLRRCDASIIYFGRASEDWISTKLQDLLKAPGFGRKKPFKAKAIYVNGKHEGINLQNFKKNNAMVLGNNGGFNPDELKPFLAKLSNNL